MFRPEPRRSHDAQRSVWAGACHAQQSELFYYLPPISSPDRTRLMSSPVARPSLVPPADVALLPYLEASESPIAILPFSPQAPVSQGDTTPRKTTVAQRVLRPLWGNHAWRSMIGWGDKPDRTGEIDEAEFWDFLPERAQDELAAVLVDRIGRLDDPRVVALPVLADRAFTATLLPDQDCIVLTLVSSTLVPKPLALIESPGVPSFLQPHMKTEMGS